MGNAAQVISVVSPHSGRFGVKSYIGSQAISEENREGMQTCTRMHEKGHGDKGLFRLSAHQMVFLDLGMLQRVWWSDSRPCSPASLQWHELLQRPSLRLIELSSEKAFDVNLSTSTGRVEDLLPIIMTVTMPEIRNSPIPSLSTCNFCFPARSEIPTCK